METIGQKLKTAREKQKMTPADVAKAIKIKTAYIEAIEKNEFHELIAPIYAKGFIKLYAQCVRLDPAPLLRKFNTLEISMEPAPDVRAMPEKKKVSSQIKRWIPNIRFTGLATAIKRIKLPELRQFSVPALKPLETPVKKRLAIIITAAVVCAVIFPVLVKHIKTSGARINVPPACRWVAEPPEPYLNMSGR